MTKPLSRDLIYLNRQCDAEVIVLCAALLGTNLPPALGTSIRSGTHSGDDVISLTVDAQLKRCGGEMRLIVPGASSEAMPARPYLTLIKAIACAHRWHEMLLSGGSKTQQVFANELGVSIRYLREITRCAFLAPDLVDIILQGRQPPE